LRQSIVPRLLAEAPQPSVEALAADLLLPRFTLIFDREGYSPDFFAELKAQRIAILTYHKYPGEKWPASEFVPHSVRLHNGEILELKLAERGTRLPNNLWVREVRRLNPSDTQTSILSTDMRLDLSRITAEIAARWSQENFLKYMREHYGLDRLIEYGTQPLPGTLVVVNPAWRRLDQSVRRERARLYRLQVEFGARALPTQPSAEQVQSFERHGGQLREKIQAQELTLKELKDKRRQTPAKLSIKDLPETERFAHLRPRKSTSSTLSNSLPIGPRAPWRAKSAKHSPATTTTVRSCDDSLSHPPIYAQTSLSRPLPSNSTASAALCKTMPSHISASF
jgi:hypothetical protein